MSGAVRSGGATDATLAAAIEVGAPNTVIWGSDTTTTDGTLTAGKATQAFKTRLGLNLGASDGNNLSQYLFFPYNVNAAAPGITTTLTITRASDDVTVYMESTTAANSGFLASAPFTGTVGQHVFCVNFAGTANNAMGTPPYNGRLSLRAGVTYNFAITTMNATGLVTLSAGSFTMA